MRSLINTLKWNGMIWTRFNEPERYKSMNVHIYKYKYSLVKHFNFYVPTRPKYSLASVTPPYLQIYWTKIFLCIINTRISTYLLNQNILSQPWNLYFNISTRLGYSFPSVTPTSQRINSTEIFDRMLNTSIASYLLDQTILSHPQHLNIFVYNRSKYSIASSTPQLLRIYLTEIFYRILDTSNLWILLTKEIHRILDTSISSYLINQNIPLQPWNINFLVSTQKKNSFASSTPLFLCIYSTRIFHCILDNSISTYSFASVTTPFLQIKCIKIFFRILNTSISTYQLDQNILLHPYKSTWRRNSFATMTPPFLRSYSTEIFFRILDTSISLYQLDQNILSPSQHLHHFVSTWPEYSIAFSTPPSLCIYLTRIFYRNFDTSISSNLIDQNIPHCIHNTSISFVSTQPEYSIASSTPQFLRIYLTRIFHCILDTSISMYPLDRNILLHPQQLHIFVSTWPEYSITSLIYPFLRIYLTRIFFRILNTSISLYLLNQNIPSHPWHLNFYVTTQPSIFLHPWRLHF